MEPMTRTMEEQWREEAAGWLEPLLLDLVSLALTGKQAHWHVTGRNFLPVHEQLDEIVSDLRTWSDLVAERAVTLGVAVDARPSTIGDANVLKDFPAGFVTDHRAVAEFADQIADVIARARDSVTPLGGADPVSQDLVIEILRGLEHHHWMLRAQATTTN
jgi:starvation-inducible DNA-binding protein